MSENIVKVKLWDDVIGYMGYEPGQQEVATFEYVQDAIKKGVQPSPLTVPLSQTPYAFYDISHRTFHGLNGFIADALPDKFGNQLIDQYFALKGKTSKEITALERLLYIGGRAMGALSFEPHEQLGENSNNLLDLKELAALANLVTSEQTRFQRELENASQEQALKLLKIGSSAGGARSKALIAIDTQNNILDGTLEYPFECSYWLLKFDSDNNSDRDKKDPKGMTRVEYVYALLAQACHITIPQTDYKEDGDDFHFLIERFDRFYNEEGIQKLHYVSWCGMTHSDRDATGAYSYEQLVLTVRELNLGQDSVEEVFKRALFNIVGRNQDDHTKNFGFLMDKSGNWVLSPAFDLTYSYDPTGKWTQVHQITLNSKQNNFTRNDIITFGRYCNLSAKKSIQILEHTIEVFEKFEALASLYEVNHNLTQTIVENLRLKL